MFKFKSQNPYWAEFSSYQTFQSVEDMVEQIKIFESTYDLTPAAKAVLNTIKLHSKRFIGVCWLYREEIARKAGVSLSSVKRTIASLKKAGILTVHEHIHTKRGGKTHNIYVINSIFETSEEPSNEPSSEDVSGCSETVESRVSDDKHQSHKNSHTNSNKTLNNTSIRGEQIDILKHVPKEFKVLMKPFYAENPELIHARWKTVCVAIKKSCISLSYTSWDTIGKAWKDTVNKLKRGRIKDRTDDGIGGYFYGVLCDYLMDDYLRNSQKMHAPL